MIRWGRRVVLIGLLVGGVGLSGCVTHRVVSLDQVASGQDVRFTLHPDRVADTWGPLAEDMGPVVEGTLVDRGNNGDLVVSVPTGTNRAGLRRGEALAQRVRVAPDGVLSVELRELDRRRTTFAVAAGSVVVLGGLVAIISGTVGGDRTGPGDTPEQMTVPLW